jgi:hypothetical protein
MDFKTRVTHSIISMQIVLNHLEKLIHTNYYKKEVKHYTNLLLPHLIKAEEEYDKFFNKEEEATKEVYNEYHQFIEAISSVPIYEQRNITLIIEAYNKDPKSIEGICKKILKK